MVKYLYGIRFPILKRPESGFISVISLLVVLAVTLAISLSVSFLSVEELKMSSAQGKSFRSFYAADACAEEALWRLKENPAYAGGNLSVGGNSCIITVTADGENRTIVVVSSANNFVRKIRMEAASPSVLPAKAVILSEWREEAD